MKTINAAVWGPVLLLIGICITAVATATSEAEPLAGAVLASISTLTVAASLLLNLHGFNQSRQNHRLMMFFISLCFTVINFFVFMYALLAGLAIVSFFSTGWAKLLFVCALIVPAIIAFVLSVRAGLPSTIDNKRNR